MRFKAKTEEQLIEENLTPPGEYDFEVIDGEDTVSANQNEMIKLKVKIFVGDKERVLFDYLLESMAFKLIHFAKATGLYDKYMTGQLRGEDCIGRSGKLELIIQEAKGPFPAKNAIKDYIVSDEIKTKASTAADSKIAPVAFEDDDIPF